MNELLAHRGPDGQGVWTHPNSRVGFAHRRLSIIDPTPAGDQPMTDHEGNWLTFNGEIYNYLELRDELGAGKFRSTSDTEVILCAYRRWGPECLSRLRGMFAFALWDAGRQTLFCARDRIGIKPFYYSVANGRFLFASEVKALLPFLPEIETDADGLRDYLAFQFCLGGKTLFKNVRELPAGHFFEVADGNIREQRYWEVYFRPDFDHTAKYFEEKLRAAVNEAVSLHLRSDTPIGSYVSGGLDSSAVAAMATQLQGFPIMGFHGKFSDYGDRYDESRYARELTSWCDLDLHEVDIAAGDFIDHFGDLIYHLDFPVAGPGSFPQFMISRLAATHRKVVLGGQGGDEIFGGYTRYLIAYFEQCIKAAINGTMHNGNFIVTYESIIPNLSALRGYEPLLQEFWSKGLFEPMADRYFRLVNRASSLGREVRWENLPAYSPEEIFKNIFNKHNVTKGSYFDLMTHFDFKTLLPALLHVEDRVSMAAGLESRVPFLDHPLVELAATVPADSKFRNGELKYILKQVVGPILPPAIVNRTDKMGFPTPLTQWVRGEARDFVYDILTSRQALERDLFDNRAVVAAIDSEAPFGRKIWGLLCLELWQQTFHDRAAAFRAMPERI